MKHAILIAIILLFSSVAYAQPACTHGTDVTPISGDHDTLAAYIAGTAVDGDVICLAVGGPHTYESQIDITNGGTIAIELRGAGTIPSQGSAGQTIIYSHAGAVFGGYEVTGSSHNPIIDNIKFTVDSGSQIDIPVVGNAAGLGIGKPWIIHHNDFAVTGMCRHNMISIATNHAVIYRNKFTSEAVGGGCLYGFTNLTVLDVAYGGDIQASWDSASTFGSADTTGLGQVYFENNYISGFLISDVTSAGRVVMRFNEFHNAGLTVHGFDSNPVGVRYLEIYNNIFACDDSGLGHAIAMSQYIADRGGTGIIHNNTFAAFSQTYCKYQLDTTGAPVSIPYYKDVQCIQGTAGWPGSLPDTHPASHQPGWGWISGSNQTVGSSTAQGQPGGAGFQQALEPFYFFKNTNNTGNVFLQVAAGAPECRAMAYSNTGKTSDTKLEIPSGSSQANPYYNVGQEAVVVFSDLVGGSTPTIADSLGNTWSALTGGTNGSLRLTAWHSHITTGGAPTITITFGSSSAARSGTLVVMRGMTASPLDINPAVATDNASPYLGPTSSDYAQTNEIVLGYFGLNGPIDDAPVATTPDDVQAISCGVCSGTTGQGIAGTTGSTASTNTVVGVTYRAVISASAIQPSLTDSGNPNGITGTVSFKVTGNDITNLDLSADGLITEDREYYQDKTMFDGSSGTGYGVRASRPATCTTGVAYWSTDQGSWNTSGSGGQGVLDKCTDGSNGNPALRWTNAWYVPYDYPNPLADVTGGSCTPDHLAFSLNPSGATVGSAFSATVTVYDSNGAKCSTATDTITIANKGGTCTGMTLGGTLSGAASAGDFSTTDLTENAAGSCTLSASASGLSGADSSPFTISAASSFGGAARGRVRR